MRTAIDYKWGAGGVYTSRYPYSDGAEVVNLAPPDLFNPANAQAPQPPQQSDSGNSGNVSNALLERLLRLLEAQQSGNQGGLTRTLEALRYGDLIVTGFVASLGSVLALARSSGYRQFILIQNTHATANMYVAFGASATVLSGFQIGPGQSLTFSQFVPQNDIFIISDTAATTAVIAYSNKDENA